MKTTKPMQADSIGTTSIIHSTTGFLCGERHAGTFQPAKQPLRINVYALHLPSGKAGKINGGALEPYEGEHGRRYRQVWGIAWDSEFPAELLRRITPKQYRALPDECKIVSTETGIF